MCNSALSAGKLAVGMLTFLGAGCGGRDQALSPPIMVESEHSHYHVHAVDASHEHAHANGDVGGHEHSHEHPKGD
jgi:hypothetical protein